MSLIHLTTFIEAPVEKLFDLSRSLEIHMSSMRGHGEKIIDGKRNGLLGLNETVTWQAKHWGKVRTLQVKITALQPHSYFCDEQVKGDFKKMKHEHFFKPCQNGTIMIDYFRFEVPYGQFGKAIDHLLLHRYMTRLLETRNRYLKSRAEEKTR
ncbi:SRPBCC family protein [Gynurincola endophyticus]|uniref:SRPBCC family protein n=1 Tax=Gynurincola endophyticus TaxID=2479004 RepID=UPI000F8C44DF|nr:SRPBCC family protein [Gynurincola endophyticus]